MSNDKKIEQIKNAFEQFHQDGSIEDEQMLDIIKEILEPKTYTIKLIGISDSNLKLLIASKWGFIGSIGE